MAGRRVGRKLKCPCMMGKLEAGSSLKSHGKLAAEAGRGGYELWPQVSPFPPRRGVSHQQEEVCEPPDGQAPPPAVGAKWDSRNWQAGSDRSLAIFGEREKERGRGRGGRQEGGERRGDSGERAEGGRPGWVLTEPLEQWSVSPLLKRAKSLMKTAAALRMKDMKRCIWM